MTKRMPRAARRASILAHATELFRQFGFGSTTTAMLAERCGITEPILYRHFDSKESLFAECVRSIEKPKSIKSKEVAAMMTVLGLAATEPNMSLILSGFTESNTSALVRNATRDALHRWQEESKKRS